MTQSASSSVSIFNQAKSIWDMHSDLREEHGSKWRLHLSNEESDLLYRADEASHKMRHLLDDRGRRYQDAFLENYICSCDEQKQLVDQLREYCENAKENISRGRGIVLFGPKGSGKDHLLMSAARYAIGQEVAVQWQNGLEIYAEVRDAMKKQDWRDGERTEESVKRPLVKAPVLWISDPLPPTGSLSEWQQTLLFEIVDRRYNHMRPTWVSMNVASGKEAEERMGAATVDRLRDGALTYFCNWQSYRQKNGE